MQLDAGLHSDSDSLGQLKNYYFYFYLSQNADSHIHNSWRRHSHQMPLRRDEYILKTRSTQRAQTSLAEADHYSHIVHCKNVEPWLWKTTHPPKKKKVLDHYLHHDLGMLPLLRCFFAHLLILQYPDHHQNLISSYLYYSGPVHKISSQSVHNFLSNVVHRQTNRQTDKLTNATKNITSFAKEVKREVNWGDSTTALNDNPVGSWNQQNL